MMPKAPRFLFIHVNQRCNLRCQHCDFWRRNDFDRNDYLSWERKSDLLEEFRRLNQDGAVVICGGESMLDVEEYFCITEKCRALGLRCLSVVNGTRIQDHTTAKRMILTGPSEVSVSLDSHIEAIHDKMRGRFGSFRMAVNALRLLLDARAELQRPEVRIYAMGLIYDENYKHLDAFYDFVLNDIKADKLKLNFLQPSFGCQDPVDEFFARHHIVDPLVLANTISYCDRKYNLHLNPRWLEQVKMYFESLRDSSDAGLGWRASSATREHICNSYDRNIVVDLYGIARLCFSPRFPGYQLRAVGDLTRFWRSAFPIREQMRRCNRFCGISHSVRSESSSLLSEASR
jgi:organic radical activating enzyme